MSKQIHYWVGLSGVGSKMGWRRISALVPNRRRTYQGRINSILRQAMLATGIGVGLAAAACSSSTDLPSQASKRSLPAATAEKPARLSSPWGPRSSGDRAPVS